MNCTNIPDAVEVDTAYGSWENVYRQHAPEDLPWDSLEAHPLLVDMLKNHRPPIGAHALDLGCGTGASSRLLASIGYKVEALDISPTAIKRAKRMSNHFAGNIRFSVDNSITRLSENTWQYDLVLDFFFLHHVQPDDWENYFRGIRHTVRLGGEYVVGVFVHNGTPFRRSSLFSSGIVSYWSRKEISDQLGGEWKCVSESYGRGGDDRLNFPMGVFRFFLAT